MPTHYSGPVASGPAGSQIRRSTQSSAASILPGVVTQARCGSWTSPLSAALVASSVRRLTFPSLADDGYAYFLEGRPDDGGRNVVCRRRADDPGAAIEDVTPPPFNVRSRVHEYGGLPYLVHRGEVSFVNLADQRLYRVLPGQAPRALSPPPAGPDAATWRFADLSIDARRGRLLAVGERHARDGSEPKNCVVAVDLGDGRVDVLVQGADFYASPTLSPDATTLAWLSWSHPHMPWDAAALFVADLDADGRPGGERHVAGDQRASVCQPAFHADGTLYFVFEPEGFWNLHRWSDGRVEPILSSVIPMEFAAPLWGLGTSTWGFSGTDEIVFAGTRDGTWQIGRIDLDGPTLAMLPAPLCAVGHLSARHGRAILTEGRPDRSTAVSLMDPASGATEIVRATSPPLLDPSYVSRPEAISFPTTAGDTAHAFFYPPRHPDFAPAPGERPPLIVMAHGGPTGATVASLNLAVQFWTTRGFAVADVNYRGSSGYGRAYRDRLYGQWGVFDVDDCVAVTKFLVAGGRVDGRRLAIRGGSAGGYTTLAALAFRDTFAAGASYYGVSDIEALRRDTHKFESHYDQKLIGPYPARRDLYLARSPIHFADRLRCPVIFFQGLEDKVVPPSQAEAMVVALRRNGIVAEYLAFAGEEHGFRKADTVARCLTAELAFYCRVFG